MFDKKLSVSREDFEKLSSIIVSFLTLQFYVCHHHSPFRIGDSAMLHPQAYHPFVTLFPCGHNDHIDLVVAIVSCRTIENNSHNVAPTIDLVEWIVPPFTMPFVHGSVLRTVKWRYILMPTEAHQCLLPWNAQVWHSQDASASTNYIMHLLLRRLLDRFPHIRLHSLRQSKPDIFFPRKCRILSRASSNWAMTTLYAPLHPPFNPLKPAWYTLTPIQETHPRTMPTTTQHRPAQSRTILGRSNTASMLCIHARIRRERGEGQIGHSLYGIFIPVYC